MASKLSFSQKHPLLFGLLLILAAMVLIFGAMAAFSAWRPGQGGVFSMGQSKLGVVHVSGTITDSRHITEWIGRLKKDGSVKGVLIRINSPGGVVAPSQEIFQAVKKCAAVKPVVASFASVAASGGYYVGCGADRIVSNPGTLTGSIGVRVSLTNLKELMDKLGISQQSITSGKYKAAGSPFEPLTPEEKAYFQTLADNIHQQFVADVAAGRGMPVERVGELADGRALTGSQALELGLVDELGGFEDALDLLKQRCGIEGEAVLLEGPEEERSILSWLLGATDIKQDLQLEGPRWELRYD